MYLDTKSLAHGNLESDHEELVKLAQELDIKTIDSFPVMEKATLLEINSYAGRGHYNEYGYKLFSTVIIDALSEN